MTSNGISLIFQRFAPLERERYGFNADQLKVIDLISQCRTGDLGSHVERCDRCSHTRVHYNSCGNRHCPNCQAVNKERWLLERAYDLLPVTYFHGVFTVPSELRSLFRYNKQLLYNLLFKCVWETLHEFSLDKRQGMQAKPGLISILHTWNQKMGYHPHIHCIIPNGGLTQTGKWSTSKGEQDFLFHVKALSSKFKQKFLIQLVDLYQKGALLMPAKDDLWNSASRFYTTKRKLYNSNWVVYAKEAFGGPEQVMEYLGRYTHKIAISNYRIKKITSTHVSFTYLDRRTNTMKLKRVTGQEFIRLFLQHVLPKRFVKIRHYGFLSTRSKLVDLHKIRQVLDVPQAQEKVKLSSREIILKTKGHDPYLCPKCKVGFMVVVTIKSGIRGSPLRFFAKDKPVKLEKA